MSASRGQSAVHRRGVRSRLSLVAALLLLALPAIAATAGEVPPPPTRWVTDEAAFLSAPVREQLDARLRDYQRRSGHQVLVWIGRSNGGVPIEEWAARAFARWKVGRAKLDDGLVLFILADDRKMRIEVGYGLEDRVPDATASRVIREVLTPGFRAGQNDAAVTRAVDTLLAAIEGRAVEGGAVGGTGGAGPAQPPEFKPSLGRLIAYGVAGLAFLILLLINPSLALTLLYVLTSGGRRRGGGGGGFSGGGGRSGGGGASGSW